MDYKNKNKLEPTSVSVGVHPSKVCVWGGLQSVNAQLIRNHSVFLHSVIQLLSPLCVKYLLPSGLKGASDIMSQEISGLCLLCLLCSAFMLHSKQQGARFTFDTGDVEITVLQR